MKIMRGIMLSGLAVVTASAVAAPAYPQTAEEFYKGKTLTILVSAQSGSLTDFIARQFAQAYVKHIPGQPEAVVMNVVGAGGMVAAASLQSKQPKDGTVIGFLQRNNLYVPLVDPSQNAFDPRKVAWIGSVDKTYYSLVAMTRSGVTTADDLFQKELVIGATGFSNENRTLPAVLNRYLGTKLTVVPGYTDRGEVYLAMERGEVDGWASTLDGLTYGEPKRMLEEDSMKVLLNLGWDSPEEFQDIPNLSQYVKDPEAKSILDFFILPFQAGRPLAAPKEVPQDRIEALRKAFDETVQDPEFIKAMTDQNYAVDPISGDEVAKIVATLFATPETELEAVRKILKP
ncbi:Bug family tripartite tricarboxylate transporter substrate binding protein [Paracoccus versutus]|uniref:Tripartite-type tricarboxylate transporter receptor subunit TctC n=1 Tax=Paracoccus versutus TaxID=34007 RepID=A0A3D9XCZ8_PARVE|nr:tripartite tricarboxylate transporter substrate-binding protein [Paracoccus versutus]REF68430.1 tripartite-type tricarboxylate transporter receptor subunit TctC [Paracoccus versutus]WGR56630.1 hypothetical protein E3U25_11090 [Paracoccus versutus]